ncbi:MAG: AtpZ/AtpI family protein [bacterium]|nr:AtpZ/AtpI family protein [bacterium]
MEHPSSKALVTTGVALQLGFSIALPLVFFIGVGIWLDKRFSLMPLFTISGVILAFAVSILQIYQVIKSTQINSQQITKNK